MPTKWLTNLISFHFALSKTIEHPLNNMLRFAILFLVTVSMVQGQRIARRRRERQLMQVRSHAHASPFDAEALEVSFRVLE